MKIWQSDLFRNSLSTQTENQWLLIICDRYGKLVYEAQCPQSDVNATWLTNQLQQAIQNNPPDKIQIFRPQIVGLFTLATNNLNVSLETTRRTPAIKEKIRQYTQNNLAISSKNYLGLDRPPPQNLPENIWGQNWNFVSITTGEIINFTQSRPLPFCDLPESLLEINAKLNPITKIPGIVINGEKKSLVLARWLVQEQPVALNYIPTENDKSGGLVLESGLVDRWILATFESVDVANAAKAYEQAKQATQGLHFLLIQPDDSGMTYTGFWLLKDEE
jgi:RNA-binding protein Tab2/Atab2